MNNLKNNLNKLTHKQKENLLLLLINLEKRERQCNQEPVFAFLQKDD